MEVEMKPCTCTVNGGPLPCPQHGMFNRLPSPALLAQMEYEERERERKRCEAELERVRFEMSMRADSV